jgi:hypothetical protein
VVFGSADAHAECATRIISVRCEEQTKISMLISPKNVFVSNDAVTVEPFATLGISYLCNFGRGQYSVCYGVKQYISPSPNRENALLSILWQSGIKCFADGVFQKASNAFYPHLFSGGLAGINGFEMVDVFSTLVVLDSKISAGDKYVGPQLSSGRGDDDNNRAKLKEGGDRHEGGKTQINPIIKRFFFALFGVLGSFFFALHAPDDERRLLRVTWLGGCGLLARVCTQITD